MIKIDKGIPLPAHKYLKYPFMFMEVGDSFVVDAPKRANAAAACCDYGRRHGKKFSLRNMGDHCRCFRIA
jgi:hypothetical protein